MPTPADLIAIAQDIAQESCLRIPMRVPGQVAHWQRHGVFFAAKAVKEMCNNAHEREDVANLILCGALVIEYAANFFAENSHREPSEPENLKPQSRCVFASITILPLSRQSLTVLLRVQVQMEYIKDVLKSIDPGELVDAETLGHELIHALVCVRLSHPTEICFLTSLNPTGFRRGQQPGSG